MSFKQVGELRKQGRLQEAMQMAEADLAQQKDNWSCSAMFWCLYDCAKAETDTARLTELADRMKEMMGNMQPSDIAQKSLDSVQKRLDPCWGVVHRAEEDSKNPVLAMQAYQTVAGLYENKSLTDGYFGAFGWIIYRALHADNAQNVKQRKQMLFTYLNLGLEAPSVLHSCILAEAARTEKQTPLDFLFSVFLRMWDLKNIRPDDWERFKTNEGMEIPSLVEKVIQLYVKEMEITAHVEPSAEFCGMLDRAIEKWPGDDALKRGKAKLFIKAGNMEQAVELYRQVLLLAPDKYYYWSELAELLPAEQADFRIGMLCKALMANAEDKFLVNVRLQLAVLLVRKGMYAEAKAELEKYRAVYAEQGWNLKSEFLNIANMIPDGVAAAGSNVNLYREYSLKADDFVFSQLPAKVMVKVAETEQERKLPDGRIKKRRMWVVSGAAGETMSINPKAYGLDVRLPIGTWLTVRLHNKRTVNARLTAEPEKTDWAKRAGGRLKICRKADGQQFGFASDIYVPGKLLKGLADGDSVNGLALRKKDGKWQFITLTKE